MLLTAVTCLALNIYHEARSEPIDSQLMVAEVTINRTKTRNKNICEVVYEHKQFSWTADNKSNFPYETIAWRDSLFLAYDILEDKSILLGTDATFYHTAVIEPYWASSMNRLGRVGFHIFYDKK